MQVISASEFDQVVHDNSVVYLFLHDASDQPTLASLSLAAPDRQHLITPLPQNDIAKASQSLLGSPPVYVSTSPDLFRKYNLSPGTPSALLAFKDKDAREPVATLSPASQPAATLMEWLYTHRFPSSLELTKDVFQQVMYAPHHPLVLIVATPQGQQEAVSSKLHEIAQKWRLRARGTTFGARDVVFTWMDATQWAKWIKEMYGIKMGTEPEIVVTDHEVRRRPSLCLTFSSNLSWGGAVASVVLQRGWLWAFYRVELGERRVGARGCPRGHHSSETFTNRPRARCQCTFFSFSLRACHSLRFFSTVAQHWAHPHGKMDRRASVHDCPCRPRSHRCSCPGATQSVPGRAYRLGGAVCQTRSFGLTSIVCNFYHVGYMYLYIIVPTSRTHRYRTVRKSGGGIGTIIT